MPFIGKRPLATIEIPVAMSLCGYGFNEIKQLRDFYNLRLPGKTSFREANLEFSYPCINQVYQEHMEDVRNEMAEVPPRVIAYGHDATFDSPGHCASIGTSIVMDVGRVQFCGQTPVGTKPGSHKIVAAKLTHVSEVKNSTVIEPEAFESLTKDIHGDPRLSHYYTMGNKN